MSNRVDRTTIVGGGTAGWLAAMMLVTILNRRTDGETVKVSLIESPNIPTVGVGEATVPGMPILLRSLGIDEAQFMLRCNASFKCGVRFSNWMEDDDGNPLSFIHPFNAPQIVGGFNPALHFHKYAVQEGASDLGDNLVPNQNFIENRRGPRQMGAGNYDAAFGYAYHLDAGLFAKFLRDESVKRGVDHILDDVTEVRLAEDGSVKELELERGGAHPIQFVVDCSGFRGLIVSQALKEPFIPWGSHLLCDHALATQVPHKDVEALDPCTSSSALGAGWVWNVPLYTRVGAGYVFSSAFRTEEEAREEFLTHLKSKNLDIAGDPCCIKMRVGRSGRSWVKNCGQRGHDFQSENQNADRSPAEIGIAYHGRSH